MRFPRPDELDDRSAWRVRDAAWTAERKARWAERFPKLKELDYKAGELKTLQKYFLSGVSPNPTHFYAEDLPSVPLIFRLWFHPDQSPENWQRQLHATCWRDYEISRVLATRVCCSSGPGMDGVDARFYEAMYGGPPTRSFLRYVWDGPEDITGVRSVEKPVHRFGSPMDVHGLALPLEYPDKNPRCFTRYAVANWWERTDDENWYWLFEYTGLKRLTRLFDLVRWFVSPEGRPEGTPGQVEFACEMHALFDGGGGHPRFQELWAEHGASDRWRQTQVRPKR